MSYSQLVTLDQMRNTVRRISGRYTAAQMPDTQIDTYINLAYTIHFPEQFKNLKLNKPYVFTTVPNVDTYDFIYEDHPTNPDTGVQSTASPGNIQITPPVYCQGYILRYYQDKTTFYNRWPNLAVNQQINTANGIAAFNYTGTITPQPFYRAQMDIFGNVTEPMVIISTFDDSGYNYTITDKAVPNNNIGNLVESNGTVVGTVNYITGSYQFTPMNAPAGNPTSLPAGDPIYAAVVPYQSSRPTDVLFYNQQIVFRPCPQQVYQVEFQISQQPTQLIASNSAPELDEWYLFICCITAKLIYTDFPDEAGMAYLMPIYQEQLQIAQRRTLRQLSSQRAQTIFSAPGWGRNQASYFFGSAYSGS